MTDLFAAESSRPYEPLASQFRPRTLDQMLGQEHLLGSDKPLRKLLDAGQVYSMILWGPPGVGKTTLARLMANSIDAKYLSLLAVTSGVKDIRAVVDQAELEKSQNHRPTLLFVDEVHRFNKSQQDGFLPFIEDGTLIFVGATTENPSFALNNALLSRCKVHLMQPLGRESLSQILAQALEKLDSKPDFSEKHIATLVSAADGDARRALNLLEPAIELYAAETETIDLDELVQRVVEGGVRRFDRRGDEFYDQISALHKSVRGSDPDATLYWLCRMLDGGCDPEYVLRRMARMASEDIGNADPRALALVMDAWHAYERLGSPEGDLSIAQAAVYLAITSKSNAVYSAWNEVRKDVASSGTLPVPLRLRNAATKVMKDLGYGEGYRYAHNEEQHYAAGEKYMPDEMDAGNYYRPSDQGLEERIAKRLHVLRQMDAKHKEEHEK
jgi:putative ATPase